MKPRPSTILFVIGGAVLLVAVVLVFLPLEVIGPRGTAEVCGPAAAYMVPNDPNSGMTTEDREIYFACRAHGTRQGLLGAGVGLVGFVLLCVGWSIPRRPRLAAPPTP